VKEGKEKKVIFDAGFTKPNCKPKWFLRKDEIFASQKYKFKNEGESYQCIIFNPKVEDSGKYTIEINGISCFAYLNVEEPDPSYTFTKPLKKKSEGFTLHDTTLECTVSSSMAQVSWWKGEEKLEHSDKYLIGKELSGVCKLIIKDCTMEDAGDYSCRLEKQPDKTETNLNIIEYPYKFVKVLKSQQLIEKDTVTLACELDDEMGEVKWYKNDEEIVPDKRVQIVKDGRKRKLVLKDAKITDAGNYRCVSNADETKAEIVINCKSIILAYFELIPPYTPNFTRVMATIRDFCAIGSNFIESFPKKKNKKKKKLERKIRKIRNTQKCIYLLLANYKLL
jgi:hypothetical protein